MDFRRWREFRIGRTGVWEFLALAIFGLFMAAFQAFGGDGPPLIRYPYWITVMVGGGVIAAIIEPWLEKVAVLSAQPPLRALAQAVAMTPPITVLVAVVDSFAFHTPMESIRWAPLSLSVFLVDVAVVLIAVLLRRALRKPAPPTPSDGVAPAAIREKLPPKLARAALLAVEAEDHYLRIHTDAGSDLILMRFRDALAALDDCDGFQTHRSWWVARRAVDRARWRKGRGELALSNGISVPVSGAFARRAKAVDWG